MKNVLAIVFAVAVPGFAPAQDCDYPASVAADFAQRDHLPQSANPIVRDKWGPKPALFAPPVPPAGCDGAEWKRRRVVAVAKKYIGLPYRHHHVPAWDDGAGPGLDCSNFTAWVYNYALGIRLDSGIAEQAGSAGRKLGPDVALQPGDLLFIRSLDDSRISHVVIYVDAEHVIDDHAEGVKVRPFAGWYKNHLAYARRVIE